MTRNIYLDVDSIDGMTIRGQARHERRNSPSMISEQSANRQRRHERFVNQLGTTGNTSRKNERKVTND